MLKKVERSWKSLWYRPLYAHLEFWQPPEPLPDWTVGRRRILFMRPDGIGDAIVSTALLQAIASVSAGVELHVLASPMNASLFRQLDYIAGVHVFDRRNRVALPLLGLRLRSLRFDAVIDPRLIAPSMTHLMLMLACRAKHRMGVGGRGADRAYTVNVDLTEGHIIELLSQFAVPFGIEPASIERIPQLPLTDGDRAWAERVWQVVSRGEARRMLINVSAGEPSRSWPEDRFVKVIRTVAARHPRLSFVIVGAPGEWERTSRVAAATGAQAVATPGIQHVIALVAQADFVFTPDTSIAHIASAFRKRAVAMYLHRTAHRWGVYGDRAVNLESATRSLQDLTAEAVVPAIDSLLSDDPAQLAG